MENTNGRQKGVQAEREDSMSWKCCADGLDGLSWTQWTGPIGSKLIIFDTPPPQIDAGESKSINL